MIVIGLTGSIGMGKTTVSAMCRRLGIVVDSADDTVHRLLAPRGAAFAAVTQQFPTSSVNRSIDRSVLSTLVFGNRDKLATLEKILHPLVAQERLRFIKNARRRGARMVVLDIPLLFEARLEAGMDAIITVSAPSFVQSARVMARFGMTETRFARILAQQLSDGEKRRRSDFVIRTGGSKAATLKQLQTILKRIDSGHARNRSRHRNHRPRPARRA